MEKYRGIKFKCELKRRNISRAYAKRISALISISRNLKKLMKAKKNEGNISAGAYGGFLIKTAGSSLTALRKNDFAFVERVDEKNFVVHARGMKEPSSEAYMHHLIYRKRKDAKFIVHFHHEKLLVDAKKLGIPTTRREQPYGTKELAREAVNALGKGKKLIALKNHGLVLISKNKYDAVKRLASLLHKQCR